MNNARKRKLERCKLLPKHGVERKQWLRTLNYREIRWWVMQERISSPTRRRMGEIAQEMVLDMVKSRDFMPEIAWDLFNGHFKRSNRQRRWMESLLKTLVPE